MNSLYFNEINSLFSGLVDVKAKAASPKRGRVKETTPVKESKSRRGTVHSGPE